MANLVSIILVMSISLNLFIVLANENLSQEINIQDEEQPLSGFVDLSNPNNPTTAEGLPVDITPEGAIISSDSGFGLIDWLKNIWGYVTVAFEFIFAPLLLMLNMGLPSYIALLLGIPLAIGQLIGLFSFIRGVNS